MVWNAPFFIAFSRGSHMISFPVKSTLFTWGHKHCCFRFFPLRKQLPKHPQNRIFVGFWWKSLLSQTLQGNIHISKGEKLSDHLPLHALYKYSKRRHHHQYYRIHSHQSQVMERCHQQQARLSSFRGGDLVPEGDRLHTWLYPPLLYGHPLRYVEKQMCFHFRLV